MPCSDQTIAVAGATAAIRVPRVRLKVVRGPDKGMTVVLERDELLVGTADQADLRLTDPTVSRNHCAIRMTARGPLLRDLGSTNGTRIEGVQVREAFVPAGAVLELGHSRVRYQPLDESVDMPLAQSERFGRLVGRSVAMRRLFARAAQVAPSDATVIIEGETGTGKDALAEAIHQASARSEGPLVVVDCGAIPPQLIESELFGHERGAFTGADRARAGAFEEADGGTLFLDEIGELPLALQPKLLRALEAREVKRLGAPRPRPVNVRVIAATNRDLREEVNRGGFRQDLYYRLEVVRLHVPPLRERPEDIPGLVEHFRRTLKTGGDPGELSQELLAHFMVHPWPGNVRELRNAVERALILYEPPDVGGLGPAPDRAASAPDRAASAPDRAAPAPDRAAPAPDRAAPAPAPGSPAPGHPVIDLAVPFKDAKNALIDEFERGYLQALLAATGGNVSEAARRADLDRVYLLKLLRRHGLRDR